MPPKVAGDGDFGGLPLAEVKCQAHPADRGTPRQSVLLATSPHMAVARRVGGSGGNGVPSGSFRKNRNDEAQEARSQAGETEVRHAVKRARRSTRKKSGRGKGAY